MTVSRKRILSGIKPSGDAHLGSYLGAMREWPNYQSQDTEVFYFIADLHALNSRPDPEAMRTRTLDLIAWLLALGINPHDHHIYVQSQIPQHSELCWILNNYTTMGELARMTQYKDKARRSGAEGQLVALFDYPVLMAADILLYDADMVPVGEDQIQHVELTRDIAKRFNGLYGEVFLMPKFVNAPVTARVMMLDEPTSKMSKSEAGEGCVFLTDDESTIRRKFSRAVTDSHGSIAYNKQLQPGVSNLLEIAAAFEGNEPQDIAERFRGKGYGDLKVYVADVVIKELLAVQQKYEEMRADESLLLAAIESGRAAVSEIAERKLAEIKQKLGML